MKKARRAKAVISEVLVTTVRRRLAENKPVRRTLPERGRLHVDRRLPFLCVYRRPHDREDEGTRRLVDGEASYLVAPGRQRHHESVATLVRELIRPLAGEFGAFLLLELWAAPDGGKANDPAVPTVLPRITVHAPKAGGVQRTIDVLESRLGRITVLKQGVEVEVAYDGRVHPPGMRPLMSAAEAQALNCTIIGLEVPPVYRAGDPQRAFPAVLQAMRRSVGLAMRQAIFEFAETHTTHRPPHYHSLGRKAVVKSVWAIDRQLAEVSDAFDYLLQLTPVNSGDAFKRFKRERFERVPEFHYRPLPFDPGELKRRLYQVAIERIEDPALQHVFQEKQEELELKISMLRDRDTPRFLHESLQLFGAVDDDLLALAESLLEELPKRRSGKARSNLDATAFAERAREEFEHYRRSCPGFKARVRVTRDVTGLIVSRGVLMVHKELSVPETRVEALLAHEVGTHLLTYYNARAQPFRQLYSGLAAYEELQEGLAVLSEYLAGGLTRSRMRQLAARVVAARLRIEGATFVDTFRKLHGKYGFPHRTAYTTTMRIYRGGGLTKDAVYLRGLRSVVTYVHEGGDLEPLYVGKMALAHVPIIRELQYRKVLVPAPMEPRHFERPEAAERLARVRSGDGSVQHLIRDEGTA